MLSKNKLRVETPSRRSNSFRGEIRKWDDMGTNKPISMREVREIRRESYDGAQHRSAMGYTCPTTKPCASPNLQSPTSYTTARPTTPSLSTHPALRLRPPRAPPRPKLPPDSRYFVCHSILLQTKYGDSSTDDILPELWAKLRAGIQGRQHESEASHEARRQIALVWGLEGTELNEKVSERVHDLEQMRK